MRSEPNLIACEYGPTGAGASSVRIGCLVLGMSVSLRGCALILLFSACAEVSHGRVEVLLEGREQLLDVPTTRELEQRAVFADQIPPHRISGLELGQAHARLGHQGPEHADQALAQGRGDNRLVE